MNKGASAACLAAQAAEAGPCCTTGDCWLHFCCFAADPLSTAHPCSPLSRQVRNFEATLLRMWDIHCEGGGPRDFEVPDQQPLQN